MLMSLLNVRKVISVLFLSNYNLRCFQLQVPDEALSLVMSMSLDLKEHDAKRALRMNNQDVGAAVNFLYEEKAKIKQKQEEDRRRQHEIMWDSDQFHTHTHTHICNLSN